MPELLKNFAEMDVELLTLRRVADKLAGNGLANYKAELSGEGVKSLSVAHVTSVLTQVLTAAGFAPDGPVQFSTDRAYMYGTAYVRPVLERDAVPAA